MATLSTNQFRTGVTLIVDGTLSVILEFQHVKPGKGGAFVRTKLKNLRNGNVIERTFKSGDTFEEAYIENITVEYTYQTNDAYHFMNLETYEETSLPASVVGGRGGFLKEHMEVTISRYQDEVIEIGLPASVDLAVASTDPGLKGDSSKAGTKPARLETGVTIQVPLFIASGEVIKVDTRTGKYLSRA